MSCEDFPCCGHERGDCEGKLYGSDASIIAREQAKWDDPYYNPDYDMDGDFDY
jgi:hypothetical protein